MVVKPRLSLAVTSLALALSVAGAPRAWASGFQLRDQSGSGQGTAYAGMSAGGSDISSMFFNPAALTRFEGNQLQLGVTGIMPSSKFSDGAASQPGVLQFGPPPATPISGATATGNIASSAVLPTFYAMWSVDQDFKLGISVNVPFGLTTNYEAGWVGRYQALKSHLETMDITPTIAYRLDPHWSVGAAFVARRAKAELSQALDLGYALGSAVNALAPYGVVNPGIAAGQQDGSVDIQGSSWSCGYKLGVLFEPSPALHIGLGYQSAVRETLKGTATFNTSAMNVPLGELVAGNPNPPASTAVAGLLAVAGPQTANGPVSAVVHLPAMISLGIVYDLSSSFSLAAEVSDTKWSTFKELRVQFSNPAAQPDYVTNENWKDTWFYALGATCHPGNAWTYRVGVAKDNSPVNDSNRTARIPDADRTWASGGLSYQFTKAFGVDLGYSHLFCKDSKINLQTTGDLTSPQFGKGSNLSGSYKNTIDILSLQARYVF